MFGGCPTRCISNGEDAAREMQLLVIVGRFTRNGLVRRWP